MSTGRGLLTGTARHGAGAGPAGGPDRRRVSGRLVALAGRAEAARLCRSPLVLAAVAVAAALVWWNSRTMVPQWWVWDVQLGSIVLVVAAAVLIAAHLAAGRVRRDGLSQLYSSYPASARARTAAHLLGLAGPLLMAAALAGAAVFWLDARGPVGAPSLVVLAGGLALVALGGAAGVALGGVAPHPMTGLLAVIVLGTAEADVLWPFGGPVQLPGSTNWLLPWAQPAGLGWLPERTPAIPPSAAHLPWLAALIALAAVAALWRAAPRRQSPKVTRMLALAAAGSLAVAGWSGWAQTRPVPTSAQDQLAFLVTHPDRVQRCAGHHGVRYCAYPGFGADLTRWSAVVDGVLGHLPARPAAALVVRQIVDVNYDQHDFSDGYPPAMTAPDSRMRQLADRISNFVHAEGSDPRLIPGSSVPPVYVDTSWGTGRSAAVSQLGLALQAAWWAARLPTTWLRSAFYSCGPDCSAETQISCLAAGQAREAVALWLAAAATPATRPAFLAVLQSGPAPIKVGRSWVSSYGTATYGSGSGSVTFTGQGAALALAMLRMAPRQVEAVLAARWPRWLSPRATDAQLAAALRLPLPSAAPPPVPDSARAQPASPVCR